MKKNNRPTIREIAQLVGVSINTVSRALNDKPDVSQETRKKVVEIARELNYTPNAIAQALVQRSTRTIGVILSDISDPFFGEMVKDAEEFFRTQGYSLILCNTQENYRQEKHSIEILINKRVDGILMTPVQKDDENILEITGSGIPVVLLGRHFDRLPVPSVTSNDEQGGYLATRHLIELGHRRILFMNVSPRISSARERLKGYQRALEEAGMDYDGSLLLRSSFDWDDAYQKSKDYFTHQKETTAVIVFCDILAVNVMKAIMDIGLRVPRQVSLVGFDNIKIGSLLPNPLTTIDPNKKEMVKTASRLLLRSIQDGINEDRHLSIEPKLIIRLSTAPPISAKGGNQ